MTKPSEKAMEKRTKEFEKIAFFNLRREVEIPQDNDSDDDDYHFFCPANC